MRDNRILYLDLVKLITIYLVILGHVLMMMVNGYAVGGRMISFIYSFHMPLFMLLSGFFVGGSALQKGVWKFLLTKTKQLLLPAVTCTVTVCIYLYFCRGTADYRDEAIGNSWFLKTLFVYYVLFYMMKRTHINDWILFAGSCILLFVIPGCSSLQVNLLFPYFWGGYLLRKYNVLEHVSGSLGYAFLFSVIYTVAYYIQLKADVPNYIEISMANIHNKGHLILFRYLVAFSGSMSVICIVSCFYQYFVGNSVISRISYYGRWTLGIYVLQTTIVANIFPDTLAWYVESELLLDVVVGPLLAILFLLICIFIINSTSKNKLLDLLLYGGQYNK